MLAGGHYPNNHFGWMEIQEGFWTIILGGPSDRGFYKCLLWLEEADPTPTFRGGFDVHSLFPFFSHFTWKHGLIAFTFHGGTTALGSVFDSGTASIKHTLSRCIESSGEQDRPKL